jgi:cysteine desulfurase family protein (TIGR01976 family)
MQSRARFPGLDEWVRLDGPAGTLPVDVCIEAIHAYLTSSTPANTGGTFDASQRTTALVEEVRDRVGRFFGADGAQIIFGPSATALVFAYTRALARTWSGSERIVCTQVDHDSNVTPWVEAARDSGASVTMLPVDPRKGTFDLADLERELRAGGVAWVALTGASNLTGWAPDLRAAVALTHDASARIHVDAVARAPHLPIDVNGWQIDSLVTSPYKWYGPHGGVLILQPELLRGVEPYRVRPADYDGPDRWETGTKSFETIAGIGGAVQFMDETPWAEVMTSERELLERLESGLRSLPGVTVYAPESAEGRAPTTIFNLDGRDPEAVAHELAHRKIAVWSGDNYACELIDAMGLRARGGAVRAGVVRYTTADDIDALLAALTDLN